MNMKLTEEEFMTIKAKLDDLKIMQSFPIEAAPIVRKLLSIIQNMSAKSQNQKILATQTQYKNQIDPYINLDQAFQLKLKHLTKQNNELNMKLLVQKEQMQNFLNCKLSNSFKSHQKNQEVQVLIKAFQDREAEFLQELRQIKFKYNQLMDLVHEDPLIQKQYIKRLLKHKKYQIPKWIDIIERNHFSAQKNDPTPIEAQFFQLKQQYRSLTIKLKNTQNMLYNRQIQISRLQKVSQSNSVISRKMIQNFSILKKQQQIQTLNGKIRQLNKQNQKLNSQTKSNINVNSNMNVNANVNFKNKANSKQYYNSVDKKQQIKINRVKSDINLQLKSKQNKQNKFNNMNRKINNTQVIQQQLKHKIEQLNRLLIEKDITINQLKKDHSSRSIFQRGKAKVEVKNYEDDKKNSSSSSLQNNQNHHQLLKASKSNEKKIVYSKCIQIQSRDNNQQQQQYQNKNKNKQQYSNQNNSNKMYNKSKVILNLNKNYDSNIQEVNQQDSSQTLSNLLELKHKNNQEILMLKKQIQIYQNSSQIKRYKIQVTLLKEANKNLQEIVEELSKCKPQTVDQKKIKQIKKQDKNSSKDSKKQPLLTRIKSSQSFKTPFNAYGVSSSSKDQNMIIKLKKQLHTIQLQKQELQSQIQQKSAFISKLTQLNQTLSSQVRKSKSTQDSRSTQSAISLQRQIQSLRSNLKKEETTRTHTSRNYTELYQQMNQLKSAYEKQISDFRQGQEQMIDQIRRNQLEIIRVQEKNQILQQKITKRESQITSLKQSIQQNKFHCEKLIEQIGDLQHKCLQHQTQIGSFCRKIKELQKDIELKQRILQKMNENKQSQQNFKQNSQIQAINQLHQKLNKSRQIIQNLQNQLKRIIILLQDQRSAKIKAQKANATLSKNMQHLERTNTLLVSQNKRYQSIFAQISQSKQITATSVTSTTSQASKKQTIIVKQK